MSTSKLARLFAELLGTFALAAVTVAVSKNYGNPLFTTIAAAATFAGLISVLGPVSGGNFNPALTLGLAAIRRIKLVEAILYVVMQVIGAVLAWKLFDYLSPTRPIEAVVMDFSWEAFWAELIGAGLLAMGFAAVVTRKLTGGHAGATAGLSLFMGSVAVAVVVIDRQLATGIINPAVAITGGYWPNEQSFISYSVAPILGSIVGMLIYRAFFSEDKVSLPAVVKPVAKVSTSVSSAKVTAKKTTPVKKRSAKKTTKRTKR